MKKSSRILCVCVCVERKYSHNQLHIGKKKSHY